MTPLARMLTTLGQAVDLNDRELIEAIKWMAIRGYGFKVTSQYGPDREVAGYDIKRD